MLQFTCRPNFTCPTQLFIIMGRRNIKQTFVPRPSCCLSFCKYGCFRKVSRFPTVCYHSEFHGHKNKGTRTLWW